MSEPATLSPFASAAPDLIALGYSALPLIGPTAQHGGKGKAPGEYRGGRWQGMSGWQKYRDETLGDFALGLAKRSPDANIGLVMGSPAGRGYHVIAVDIDATDADALDTLMRACPPSPMSKRGFKGETRLFRAEKTLKTRSYDGPDGRLIDLLTGFDTRQTVVPPSIHPDTGQPYVWLKGPVAAADLPVFDADDLQALEEALEQCGWVRGGRAAGRVVRAAPAPVDDDDLWSETKAAALANLSAWVPALDLYNLRPARGGYEAVAHWRASSTGRAMAERKLNLSVQATGIKDFGTNDTYSAIDLVMAARDVDQSVATTWLRERLGLDDTGVVIELGMASVVPMPSADMGIPITGKGVVQTDPLCDADLPEPLRGLGPVIRADIAEKGIAELQKYAFKPEPINITPTPGPADSTGPELPDHLTRPPGLVGEITDWICDTALQPQRLAALLAALEIVGTAAGRTFSGPTKTGTHLYGLFLAPSGASKDHPLKCIDRILRASTMAPHVGPGEFMSMSALVSRLNRQPLTITPIDEFGDYLARINGRKSSPHEKAITRTLRTAWGSSFDTMATPEWAGRVGEPIFSPALSIYGASTHESFFKGLDGDDVFNGFLNRFLIFSTFDRVDEVEPAKDKYEVPASISDALVKIYTSTPALTRATMHNSQSDGAAICVPWGSDYARSAYMAYKQTCMRREDDAVFYTRSAEIAQRLATIRAIGRDGTDAQVGLEDMDWGIALADMSARDTVAMAGDYMSETLHQGEAQKVLRAVKRTWMPYRDVARALNNRMRARDLRDMLDGLVDGGDLEREERLPPSGGHKIKFYRRVA